MAISEADHKALQPFRSGPRPVDPADDRLKHLIDDGYLTANDWTTVKDSDRSYRQKIIDYKLTIKGVDALDAMEKQCNQDAEEKTEKRNERSFQIFLAVFSALVGVVVAELFEHRDQLLSLAETLAETIRQLIGRLS